MPNTMTVRHWTPELAARRNEIADELERVDSAHQERIAAAGQEDPIEAIHHARRREPLERALAVVEAEVPRVIVSRAEVRGAVMGPLLIEAVA